MTIEIPGEEDFARESRGRPPLVDITPLLSAAKQHAQTGIKVKGMPENEARSAIRRIRKLGGYRVSQRRMDSEHIDVYIKPLESR